jgi:quercetin dioxygenase-like cupin family protein
VDDKVQVERWAGDQPPEESVLQEFFARERLLPYRWSNAAGDVYAAHVHDYDKVIYVVRGVITFGLPASGMQINLQAGDRLELPAGVLHDARVGAHGVVCLEAHC